MEGTTAKKAESNDQMVYLLDELEAQKKILKNQKEDYENKIKELTKKINNLAT